MSDVPIATGPDSILLRAMRRVLSSSKITDILLHAPARLEACYSRALHLPSLAAAELRGAYTSKPVLSHPLPVASDEPSPTTDSNVHLQHTIERERQALEQIWPSIWSLQAAQVLFGTTSPFIAEPVIPHLCQARDAQILDFGGKPTCDWSWNVALLFPLATVTTFCVDSDAFTRAAQWQGPDNHVVVEGSSSFMADSPDSASRLPFPDASFDLISARSLHSLVRQPRTTSSSDPAASPSLSNLPTLLAEFKRILKPGGYLEFALLDAHLHTPSTQQDDLSAVFAARLRDAGYVPVLASRNFMPALLGMRGAWQEVKRTWLALPCGTSPETDASRFTTEAGQGRARYFASSRGTEQSAAADTSESVQAALLPFKKAEVSSSDLRLTNAKAPPQQTKTPERNVLRRRDASVRKGSWTAGGRRRSERFSSSTIVTAERAPASALASASVSSHFPPLQNDGDGSARATSSQGGGTVPDPSEIPEARKNDPVTQSHVAALYDARAYLAWAAAFERQRSDGGDESAAVREAARELLRAGKEGGAVKCLVGWVRRA